MQTSTNESGRRLNERRSIWRSAAPRVCFAFDHARESLPLFFSPFCRIARSCRAQSLDWTPCDFRNPLLWFEEVRRRYWRRILKFPAETGSVCARAGLQTTSIWRSHESLYWPFDLCAWSTRPAPHPPPPTHPASHLPYSDSDIFNCAQTLRHKRTATLVWQEGKNSFQLLRTTWKLNGKIPPPLPTSTLWKHNPELLSLIVPTY